MSTLVMSPAVTSTCRISFLNPWASTSTLYFPAVKAETLKSPDAPEEIARLNPVSALTTWTFALGTIAPDGSRTAPEIVPVGTCAPSLVKHKKRADNVNRHNDFRTIFFQLQVPFLVARLTNEDDRNLAPDNDTPSASKTIWTISMGFMGEQHPTAAFHAAQMSNKIAKPSIQLGPRNMLLARYVLIAF
jgi:hypothetical protein